MKEVEHKKEIWGFQFWKRLAVVAAVFSFVVSILLIANYLQLSKADPVNTQIINALVERLHSNPNDAQLRNEIREMDLLVRKAYFTNQWQVRTGAYLLLAGLALLILAYQVMESKKGKQPIDLSSQPEDQLEVHKNARKWVGISGGTLVIIALIVAFLTQNQLQKNFVQAAQLKTAPNTSQDVIQEAEPVSVESTSDYTTKLVTNEQPVKPLSQPEDQSIKTQEKPETQSEPALSVKEKAEKTEPSFPTWADLQKNYPSFRGPGGLGIDYHKNIPTQWNAATGENILWKVAIPLPGFNSPIIWGDKIFLAGASETAKEVYCIDRLTGKLLWKTTINKIQGEPSTAPKVTSDTGLSASTMTTDGKKVFAIFADGDLVALDFDGKIIWQMNIGVPQNHYGYASSLIIYKDKLIIQYDDKAAAKVMALSVNDGKTSWSTKRAVKISWSSPVVANYDGKAEILLVADPLVASYDAVSGKENWNVNSIYGEVGPSVAYADGMVFALNEYAKLVAIKDVSPAEVVWENDEYLSDVPSPVAYNGLLFVITSYGTAVCYDAKTGEKYWEHELNENIYSSPVISEGNVFIMDKKGTMHIFKAAKSFQMIAEPALGEPSVCTPAFADGFICIRANKNLYGIGKPVSSKQ